MPSRLCHHPVWHKSQVTKTMSPIVAYFHSPLFRLPTDLYASVAYFSISKSVTYKEFVLLAHRCRRSALN